MAVVHGTLAKEVDGKVDYIYPKTLASIVEYDESDSVKSKIQKIDKDMTDVNARITNIVSAIKYGSLGTYNDAELIDIRVPNYNVVPEDTIYDSAGEAVRGQFEEIIKLIDSVKTDLQYIRDYVGMDSNIDIAPLSKTVIENKYSIENNCDNIENNTTKIEEIKDTIESEQWTTIEDIDAIFENDM